ncbi:MAG: extracellular solute-binding protein [Eubacterium sp.]|jgi:putative aldouronate transport system substrate-binding protein|nr:extracellular solute-binding protein [Eubacterium sp.]
MVKGKKKTAFLLAILMVALFIGVSGCKENSEMTGSSSGSDKGPVTWMSMLHYENPPSDEVVDALSEIVGADIEFLWVPDGSKEEKINTALASKELADIVSLTLVTTNSAVRGALIDGVFWDIEPYLKDYPNLAKITSDRLDAARVNGKLYGVPMQKPYARYGLLIRQDWLDNLGLPVPKTFEDIMETAKAFTEGDPDGNGIDDTVGLVERAESFTLSFRNIASYYGAPNYFEIDENGKVTSSFKHDGFYKAAESMRYLYENGYMNSDWLSMPKNDQKEFIVRSRGGMSFMVMFEAKNYQVAAEETGQAGTMKWTIVNDITTEGVPRRALSDTSNGFGGLLAIPKTEVSEERLPHVLSVLDKLNSEEAFEIMTYGIEGVHYELTPEKTYKVLDDSKLKQEVLPLNASRPNEMWTYLLPTADELDRKAYELILDNEPYAVFNECQSLESPTYTSQWNSLLIIVQDAYSKYVIGDITMEEFKAEVDRWLAEGGQAILDEYEADNARVNSQ